VFLSRYGPRFHSRSNVELGERAVNTGMCVSTRIWLTRGGRGFLSVEKRTFSRLSRVDAQRLTTDLACCARAPGPAGRDAGRSDRIGLVFARRLMTKGLRPTPGRFRTRVLTEGLTPSLRIDYKHLLGRPPEAARDELGIKRPPVPLILRPAKTVGVGLVAAVALLVTGTEASAAPSGSRCSAAAVAGVELSSQRAWLLRGGTVTYESVPVATGKASAPTPWVCSAGRAQCAKIDATLVVRGGVAFPGFLVEQSADRRGGARIGSRGRLCTWPTGWAGQRCRTGRYPGLVPHRLRK
jgi:hypothetical protein